mgnify:CR=1 FL=1
MSYLLRVQLPDRPGSLGALAVALGSVGADILSLDVVERGDGFAIDDLVVDVEPGALPDTLITAAEHLPDVLVDSIRPYAGILDTHRELELIDSVATARNDRLQVLVDGAPRLVGSLARVEVTAGYAVSLAGRIVDVVDHLVARMGAGAGQCPKKGQTKAHEEGAKRDGHSNQAMDGHGGHGG